MKSTYVKLHAAHTQLCTWEKTWHDIVQSPYVVRTMRMTSRPTKCSTDSFATHCECFKPWMLTFGTTGTVRIAMPCKRQPYMALGRPRSCQRTSCQVNDQDIPQIVSQPESRHLSHCGRLLACSTMHNADRNLSTMQKRTN